MENNADSWIRIRWRTLHIRVGKCACYEKKKSEFVLTDFDEQPFKRSKL